MPLDLTNFQTRDKRRVTLYTVDGPGGFPLQGVVEGEEIPTAWTKEGKHCEGQHHLDLVSLATTRTMVLVMYEYGLVVTYDLVEWEQRSTKESLLPKENIVASKSVTLERGVLEVPIKENSK